MEILSPKIDVIFKLLFTGSDSEDILTDFLASVLDIETGEISSINILNSDMLPETLEYKYSRLDIAMEVGERKINVEMQLKKFPDFRERVLFYWSKLYSKDLKEGESYKNLKQTISINILDYKMFDCEECHSIFRLREENRNELLTDKCRFDFLELPKADSDSRQIKRLRRWMRFFNIKNEGDADMIAQANDNVMNKAVFILKKMSADEKTREIARIREKALHDEASYMETARLEGKAEGLEEGRINTFVELVKKGLLTLAQAAAELGMSVPEFEAQAGLTA